jgi:hypothetical protein
MPLQVSLSMLLGAVISFGIMEPAIETYHADYSCPINGTGSGSSCDLANGKWYNGHLDDSNSIEGIYGYKVFTALAIILVDAVFNLVKVCSKIIGDLRDNSTTPDDPNYTLGEAAAPRSSRLSRNSIRSRASETLLGGSRRSSSASSSIINNIVSDSDGHDSDKDRVFCSDEVPTSVWLGGLAVCGAVAMIILPRLFPVQWYLILAALLSAPLFSVGIIYGTGTFRTAH